jgi:Leucine-rich repeat (LRR) protein
MELDEMYGTNYIQNYYFGKIMVSGNLFSSLSPDFFANVSQTLQVVHMHANPALTTLPAGLFSNMPRLHTVIAHHTMLEAIPDSLFENSPLLSTIWLNNNNIQTVAADAFAGVGDNLSELYMNSNNISVVEPGTFDGLTGIKMLKLTENRLTQENFTCALLCDIPVTSTVQVFRDESDKLFCGNACDVDLETGQIGAWVNSDVCGYDKCVSWDLSPAAPRGAVAWLAMVVGMVVGLVVA